MLTRILGILAAVAVFAALFVIDTTALLRLGLFCVTGGCGVPSLWLAVLGGGVVVAAFLALRPRRAKAKTGRVAKVGRSSPARRKAAPRSKPKPAK